MMCCWFSKWFVWLKSRCAHGYFKWNNSRSLSFFFPPLFFVAKWENVNEARGCGKWIASFWGAKYYSNDKWYTHVDCSFGLVTYWLFGDILRLKTKQWQRWKCAVFNRFVNDTCVWLEVKLPTCTNREFQSVCLCR